MLGMAGSPEAVMSRYTSFLVLVLLGREGFGVLWCLQCFRPRRKYR